MEKANLKIFDKSLNFIGEIDDYTSLLFIRKWDTYGSFEFRVNSLKDIIKEGYFIVLNNDPKKSGIIEYIELNREEVNGYVVKGFTLGYLVSFRITFPPTGQGYDTYNINTETIINDLVVKNCTAGSRAINFLEVEASTGRGNKTNFQTRYKPLQEELTSIAKLDKLGYEVEFDFINKKFIFKVYEGRNLTINQNVLPPMLFSKKFDNVRNENFVISNLNYKNTAIVAGQGEGENREIIIVNDDNKGWNRRELFVDARDLSEGNLTLQDRGKMKLAECEKVVSFDSEVETEGYIKEWDLGDFVTVYVLESGITLDKQIVEVKEVYEDSGNKIELNFGDPLKSLDDKIKELFNKPIQENNKVYISADRPPDGVRGTQWKQLIN